MGGDYEPVVIRLPNTKTPLTPDGGVPTKHTKGHEKIQGVTLSTAGQFRRRLVPIQPSDISESVSCPFVSFVGNTLCLGYGL